MTLLPRTRKGPKNAPACGGSDKDGGPLGPDGGEIAAEGGCDHWSNTPLVGRGEIGISFSRCAFCSRPEVCGKLFTNGPPKMGRRSAERRGVDSAGRQQAFRLVFASIAARAPSRRRARLPALYRGSRQNLPALAQSGPALHGSGQPIRSPGSQLLADRRRGRPGEFPNRPRTRLRAPSRAPLPLHQSAVTG